MMTAVDTPELMMAELQARIDRHAREVLRLGKLVHVLNRLPPLTDVDVSDTVSLSTTPTPVDIPWPVRELPPDNSPYDPDKERLVSLGRAVAGVAHDFNNLLSVVQGYAEILAEQSAPGSFPREAADTIAATSEAATSVAKHLLEVARPAASTPDRTDVTRILNRLARVVKAIVGANVTVQFDASHVNLLATIHPADFTQVLLNLTTNAHDAMPYGGHLIIRTELFEGMVIVMVRDTGLGMSPETQRQMFDANFTTKHCGTGMGLATVRMAIERAGGSIVVDSQPGRGTDVVLAIPAVVCASA
jgi:signal transduction histidine kinase